MLDEGEETGFSELFGGIGLLASLLDKKNLEVRGREQHVLSC